MAQYKLQISLQINLLSTLKSALHCALRSSTCGHLFIMFNICWHLYHLHIWSIAFLSVHTHACIHHFNGHFPPEPGLTVATPPSLFLCILLGQASTIHILPSNLLQMTSVLPCSVTLHCHSASSASSLRSTRSSQSTFLDNQTDYLRFFSRPSKHIRFCFV